MRQLLACHASHRRRHRSRYPAYSRGLVTEELEDRRLLSLPNLYVTSVQTVDGAGKPFVPQAGEPFGLRVDFLYDNPVNAKYTISRSVNGWPAHTSPPVDWGSGLSGTTSWVHVWGAWVLHKAGVYETTVMLDSENAIAESNEIDNRWTGLIQIGGTITPEWALVKAEEGRSLLGDGTDVIVGTMDDAFDFNHPWFQGVDSRGRPRLVASLQNTLGIGGSPVNADHATVVMGIVLAKGANDGDLTGLAPDARFVSAEFINRANIPGHAVSHVVDAAGFLVENGAEVINMSWSWWFGTVAESESGETSVTNLLADYLAYGRDIVAVPSVNQLTQHDRPTAPGSSRNVITVGGLEKEMQRAWSQQDHGPTLDGRSKPDILGNAAEDVVATSANWRNGFLAGTGFGGTSVSSPFVTGAVAQMLDFGKSTGQNLDHRVIKAVIMNSGVKAFDDDGTPWSNSPFQPLDDQQGTGILDMIRVHRMYAAGEQPPGPVPVPGYDFAEIQGVTQTTGNDGVGRQVYQLGTPDDPSADLDVTLVWDRHTFWNDVNNNGHIDAADSFFVLASDAQDNLDLLLYRDGVPVARSESTVDNVEHLHLTDLRPGNYELHVLRRDVANSGLGEEYSLAWHSTSTWQAPDVPPEVADVLVSGQSWTPAVEPFSLATGPHTDGPLPWLNLDRIDVVFSKDVDVVSDSLALVGVNVLQYLPDGFHYDSNRFTATWSFAEAFDVDKLFLNLAGEATDSSPIDDRIGDGGQLLGGGSDYEIRFDVLPGDSTGDGVTDIGDLVNIATRVPSSVGPPPTPNYSPEFDVNGDGTIDIGDLVNVATRVPSSLPAGEPGELDKLGEAFRAVVPTLQPGDANRDFRFDQLDLVQALQAGKYRTDTSADWSEGDWNGDLVFDELDLVAALGKGDYVPTPYAAVMANDRFEFGSVSVFDDGQQQVAAVDQLLEEESDLADLFRIGWR